MPGEGLGVGRVHDRVVADVVEEDGRLHHALQRCPFGLEEGLEVGEGLARLSLDPAVDERAVSETDLAGDDQPVAGADDRRVRADRRAQGDEGSA